MQLIRKTVQASDVKVLDEAQGIIESFVNTLGVWDHDEERMKDGCFDAYVAKAGRLPKVAWFHDQKIPVGKCIETQQVDSKQRVVTQFNMDTQRGREAYSDVAGGYVDEWSVGFYALADEWLPMEGKTRKGRQINEIDWVEYSPVMRGASPDTSTGFVKERETEAKIAHRDGEPESPPKGYPTDATQYADPENFKWPLDSRPRIHSAIAYFNAGAGKSKYSGDEWSIVGHRIVAAARAEFGDGYTLEGDTITTPNTASKARSAPLAKFLATAPEGSYEDLLDDLRSLVAEALCGERDPWGYDYWPYCDIAATFPGYCIAVIMGGDTDGDVEYFRIPYTIGTDQEPVIGDPEPVNMTFTPSAHPHAEPKGRAASPEPVTSADAAASDAFATRLKLQQTALRLKGVALPAATEDTPEAKSGARNSAADQQHIQAAHDHLAAVGAMCQTDEGGAAA